MTTTSRAQGNLPKILFIDDSIDFLHEIRFTLLSYKNCEVIPLSDSKLALEMLEQDTYSAVFLDWIMPDLSGGDLLPLIVDRYPNIPVVVMTGVNDVETAVNCMKEKAFDYITKPVESERLILTINRALEMSELTNQNQQMKGYLLGKPLGKPELFSDILTHSEKMRSIFKLIETISRSRYPVFIAGETGVGKELIAKAVHRASGLNGEFVAINVAAIDLQTMDDTLFGHRKGAFTGANDAREGLIGKAQGGSLFLDEIGDMPAESQIKLLRLLQEGEYYRMGSDTLHKSTARIIVASNKNFEVLLAEGKFREDLYHRLLYHKIEIPPLRDRREDIMPLVKNYVAIAAKDVSKPPPRISSELSYLLTNHNYPGNVRELIYRVTHATISNTSGVLTTEDFPDLAVKTSEPVARMKEYESGQVSFHAIFPAFPTMDEMEILLVREAIKKSEGKQGAAAELLGVCRQTVMKRMKEIGIEASVFTS